MFGSPPPWRAAMMIARLSLLHSLPRLASTAPFLCLIVAQWEWPDMAPPLWRPRSASGTYSASMLRVQYLELQFLLNLLVAVVGGPAPGFLVQFDRFLPGGAVSGRLFLPE